MSDTAVTPVRTVTGMKTRADLDARAGFGQGRSVVVLGVPANTSGLPRITSREAHVAFEAKRSVTLQGESHVIGGFIELDSRDPFLFAFSQGPIGRHMLFSVVYWILRTATEEMFVDSRLAPLNPLPETTT